jgi:cyclic pyranopterin phosphate synthase
MEGITANITILRSSQAEVVLKVSDPRTLEAIVNDQVPKGNVFEMAKVAGLFAVKNTHHSLAHSYAVQIEYTGIEFQAQGMEVRVTVTVKSICNSDLDSHALHGASIVALTMYDMLKPIDKGISIEGLKVVEKPGKARGKPFHAKSINAAVVVCSNSVSSGSKTDSAGQIILKKLRSLDVKINSYEILSDNPEEISAKAVLLARSHRLVIFCGGTGLSSTDMTREALEPILEKRVPGIEEAMRCYGQSRTPYAMLSRSLAGLIGDCLILALPGSTRGAEESMNAIFPHVLKGLFHMNGHVSTEDS